VYHKADVIGLQNFLRDNISIWASNGRCVEDVWNNFKKIIFQRIERFIPHKLLRKNSDPDYYNKDVKWFKFKGQKSIQ
jgi:hypothetical protein